jgi:hypothetical protein
VVGIYGQNLEMEVSTTPNKIPKGGKEWHFQYWNYLKKKLSHIINSSPMLVFEVPKGLLGIT